MMSLWNCISKVTFKICTAHGYVCRSISKIYIPIKLDNLTTAYIYIYTYTTPARICTPLIVSRSLFSLSNQLDHAQVRAELDTLRATDRLCKENEAVLCREREIADRTGEDGGFTRARKTDLGV